MSIESKAGALKNSAVGVAILGAVLVVGYLGWKGYKAAAATVEAVKKGALAVGDVIGTDLNPADPENIVNRGAHAALGSDGSWSIGTWLYDVTHPNG